MARKMKDSGIEWIGEIPEGWSIARGKHILTLLQRAVSPTDGVITCFRDGEVTLRSNRREDGFTVSLKEIGYQGIEPGDLVVHGMDGFAGSIGISDSRGKSSPVLVVLDSSQDKKYLMYYLRSMAYNNVFLALSTGIRVRSCDLKWNKLADLLYLVPSIVEQHKLVIFLDEKCSEIDAMLSKTRSSIEEYKKLKQAVITQAVTKGVRGKREMKDSGVEWIGEIPKEWDILNLVAHTSMLTPMRDRPENLDGPIPWIRIEDFDGKYISSSKASLGVSKETVQSMNLKIYPVGTILCTSSCIMGKCAIVSRELVSNQRFIGIIPDQNTCENFLYYLMLSNSERMNYLATGALQANLSRSSFEHLKVQFPSYQEQKEIADYLDAKCAEIDRLIAKKEQLVKQLESYKKSLIYEVVTGKREV